MKIIDYSGVDCIQAKKMKEKTKAVEKNLYPLTTCHLIAEKKKSTKTNE